jgi:hypothetical protein
MHEVIVGLHDGVATMRPQEVACFEIAPEYAFGGIGIPEFIPPDTTVLFEVEMLGQALVCPRFLVFLPHDRTRALTSMSAVDKAREGARPCGGRGGSQGRRQRLLP